MKQGNRNSRAIIVALGGALIIILIFVLMSGGRSSPGSRPGGAAPLQSTQTTHITKIPQVATVAPVSQTPYPTITSPVTNRSTPQPVYEQVEISLEENNIPALYAEMSPGLREDFSLDSLLESEAQVKHALGEIVVVEIIEPLTIRTEPDFNSEWADATVRVHRTYGEEIYLVRFRLEAGEWWLFGTLKESP